eukprot:c27113_g1_i3 orf=243-962(+)
MDLTPFSHDIDGLIEAFVKIEGTELSQMKELWQVHMVTELPLSEKLGGLYVLYTLYETQQIKPPFNIYLSTEDLEALYSLVVQAKAEKIAVALKVVQTMMCKNMFLFGSVAVNQKKIAEAVDKLAIQAADRLRFARRRLLSNLPVQQHLTGNLVTELGLNELAMLNEEYAIAKQRVFNKATPENGMKDAAIPMVQDEINLGEELKKDIQAWINHRESLYEKEDEGEASFAMELTELLEE